MNPSNAAADRFRDGCACLQAAGPAWPCLFATRCPALLRDAVELVVESRPE